MIGDIISMILALAGTVFVIALTYYASKWYARRMGPLVSAKHIKVVDRLPVSKGGSVLIIDIEGKQYMLGVGEHRVELLKELEEPIDFSSPSTGEGTAGSFQHMFHSLIKKVRNNERGVD